MMAIAREEERQCDGDTSCLAQLQGGAIDYEAEDESDSDEEEGLAQITDYA